MAGRPVHTFEVVGREELTRHMVRVLLGGSGFDTFKPSDFTDSYVKVVFVADDVDVAGLAQPLTLDSFDELPAERRPVVRTLTVRRADPAARELAIDVVTHGEHGTAGTWAAQSRTGPAGVPDGSKRRLRPRPVCRLAPVGGRRIGAAGHQRRVGGAARRGGRQGVHRGRRTRGRDRPDRAGRCAGALDLPRRTRRPGSRGAGRGPPPLIEAVKTAPWLPGQVQVFIHGEAQAVMHNLRPYIRRERGVEAKWASISGYWRRGRTEETFRQWKKELARAEAAGPTD